MVGSNLAILAPVSQNMLLGLSYFCFMYRILTAFLLISLLGTRAGAQRGERLQPKPALLRLI